jgi:hypothetical protein
VNRLLTALALLFSAAPAWGSSPNETLARAEHAFAEGTELRHDSVRAKPAFARAAAIYDDLWNEGFRTPELALNRSRAHRLAGDLPKSIAALHDGLAVARFARPLQVELEDARAAVQFPLDGELASQCRPKTIGWVSQRFSPADSWVLAGLLWFVVCAAMARFAMTRNLLWLAFSGLALAGLAALGWLWFEDTRARQRIEALPLLIVSGDAMLRKGNADAFPSKLEPALPKGVEVRERLRRGGWVQVELASGVIGWLPEPAVIPCAG